jgi:hypothetical protein
MAAATWKTMNAPIQVKKKSSAKLRNANFISYPPSTASSIARAACGESASAKRTPIVKSTLGH